MKRNMGNESLVCEVSERAKAINAVHEHIYCGSKTFALLDNQCYLDGI